MVRDLVTAQNVHGHSGLDLPDGATLPDPTMKLQSEHAVYVYYRKRCCQSPQAA